MGRFEGTQIGADGKRHPIGEGPTDPSPFRVKHRSLDVAGAARDIEAERAADIDAGMAAGKARLAEMAKLDKIAQVIPDDSGVWEMNPDVFVDASATPAPGPGGGHIEALPDTAGAPLLADSGHAQEAMHQAIRDLAEIEEEPTEVEPAPEGEITLTDTTEELPAGPVATALGDDYSDYDNDQEETPDAP